MDLVFIIVGVILIALGAGRRDAKGERTGPGISQLTIGVVLTVVGVLWFSIGFINGFNKGYSQASQSNALQDAAISPFETPTDTSVPAPAFPSEMNGNATYNWMAEPDGIYDLAFSFNNPNGVSVTLSIGPTEWTDPGSIPVTSGTKWTFTNLPANSTQYVNMKAMVNGNWSQVTAWKVQVPTWVSYRDTFINSCSGGTVYCTCFYDSLRIDYTDLQIQAVVNQYNGNLANNDPVFINALNICYNRFRE